VVGGVAVIIDRFLFAHEDTPKSPHAAYRMRTLIGKTPGGMNAAPTAGNQFAPVGVAFMRPERPKAVSIFSENYGDMFLIHNIA